MPYRGRPSPGCLTCRQRKIKCDRRKQSPGCENCEKAGWTCPGYRDLADLLFHDESAKVVRKIKAARPRPRGEQSLSEKSRTVRTKQILWKNHAELELCPATTLEQVGRSQTYPPRHTPGVILPPSLENLAVGFFFSRYVFTLAESCNWSIEDGNGCLMASIKALGTAGITRNYAGPSLSLISQKEYLKAIQLINVALRSPQYVKRDSTLLAIHLLSIFETVAGFHSSLDAWSDHVRGAAALLHLRGAEQFETAVGGRLFLQISINLVISCMERRQPLPKEFLQVQKEAAKCIPDPREPVWRFHIMNLRFADVFGKVSPTNAPWHAEQAEFILKEALGVEAEMISIMSNPPTDWQYETVEATGPTVFAGYYHVYPAFLVAQVMNALHSSRIILVEIILKALEMCPNIDSVGITPAQMEQIQQSSNTVEHLQLEILASVPQHIGPLVSQSNLIVDNSMRHEPPDSLWVNFTCKDMNPWHSRRKESPELPPVRMSGGYLIQWPLFVAGAADVPTGPIRTWVIGVLQTLGRTMGLQQALLLASWLETEDGLHVGSHHRLRHTQLEMEDGV